jgi:SAM-dependent MidA family methyltransferase
VSQSDWLRLMGIDARAEALRRASPGRGAEITAARERLTASNLMGRLFKVMALAAPDWPEPAGFA